MRIANFRLIACAVTLLTFAAVPVAKAAPTEKISPKVLVVVTYETGKDTGDTPGELQYWAEREHLSQKIQVPGLEHPLLTNGTGLYLVLSGVTSRSGFNLMALAMDTRFDLRKSYILLAGIGGADPKAASLGSAIWVRDVVDGDPSYEIDSKETPAGWKYGTIALGAELPGKIPGDENAPAAGVTEETAGGVGHVAFHLNRQLVDWAFAQSKDIPLADSDGMQKERARFAEFAEAVKPPHVLEGESMGSDHFWHGRIMTAWAEDWVRGYLKGKGELSIADCEDQGVALAVEKLSQLGRVDGARFLVLRTASNFTEQAPGVSASRSLFDGLVTSSAYLPSLDAAHKVASVVAHKLIDNWSEYENRTPESAR